MFYTFIILICVSFLLLLFSFLKENKVKTLEKQLEQLSLTVIKEQYQTNKRFDILEEELFILPSVSVKKNASDDPVSLDQQKLPASSELVHTLHENGYPIEEVAKILRMPREEIKLILSHGKQETASNE
ncbi:hypothetical protein FZC66_02105 [Priestia megaterium]|nr:hypothetical protein FZC66_02105 [Priestia megaterium]